MAVGLEPAGVRRHLQAGVPRLPARHHAARATLYWYNDCYALARRHLAFQRPGAAGAGVPRRAGAAASSWAGRISPTSAACAPARSAPTPPTSSRKASSSRRPSSIGRRRHQRGDAEDLLPQLALPEQNVGDMRALMASAALGVKRIEEIAGALRHRRRWPMACASSWRARATWCAPSSPRPSTTARHRFTDAIDPDGHGNGPFHLRCWR